MRNWSKAWRAALLAPVVVLLAGCSGGSILPGQGGTGGLGTIGTDTGNPDEGLVFRLPGAPLGDFVADTVRFVGGDPRQIEAVQEAGPDRRPTMRTLAIRFNSLPVAGGTFTVGEADTPAGVQIRYVETRPPGASTSTNWEAESGQVKISAAGNGQVAGTFSARLVPIDPSKPTLDLKSGAFHLKASTD